MGGWETVEHLFVAHCGQQVQLVEGLLCARLVLGPSPGAPPRVTSGRSVHLFGRMAAPSWCSCPEEHVSGSRRADRRTLQVAAVTAVSSWHRKP